MILNSDIYKKETRDILIKLCIQKDIKFMETFNEIKYNSTQKDCIEYLNEKIRNQDNKMIELLKQLNKKEYK